MMWNFCQSWFTNISMHYWSTLVATWTDTGDKPNTATLLLAELESNSESFER